MENKLTTDRTIRVIVCEPGKEAEEKYIENTLQTMQNICGGPIKAVYPEFNSNVVLIVNEEGKIRGLDLNRSLTDEDGTILDVITGTFLITGTDFDTCDFGSLTDAEAKMYMERFRWPEVFFTTSGRIWSREVRAHA